MPSKNTFATTRPDIWKFYVWKPFLTPLLTWDVQSKSSKNLQHKVSLHQISRTFNHHRFNCNCCGYINNYIYMREKYLLIDVDGIFRYIWTRSDNVMISKYNPSYKMIICSTPSRMVRLYTTRLLTVWFHLEMFTCFTYFSSSWPR